MHTHACTHICAHTQEDCVCNLFYFSFLFPFSIHCGEIFLLANGHQSGNSWPRGAILTCTKRAHAPRINFQILKPRFGHSKHPIIKEMVEFWQCLMKALKSIQFRSCEISQTLLWRKERSKKRATQKRILFFSLMHERESKREQAQESAHLAWRQLVLQPHPSEDWGNYGNCLEGLNSTTAGWICRKSQERELWTSRAEWFLLWGVSNLFIK